jgi:hypothetical protein
MWPEAKSNWLEHDAPILPRLCLFDQAHARLDAKLLKINSLLYLAAHVACAWSKRHKRGSRWALR